ncbi:IS66 family transposase [Spartinivicinus marinus]|nr:IS66 family transposase [Spartinivicinus marinus]MCX4030246.1 IS66 family transposase [Spartinivicinus marinus]MCX4030249.1 IS66 family transposase [Spartinivicinus marinus]
MTQTTTINRTELQALKQRISEAQAYGLSLSQEDNQYILDALMTLEHLQQQLHTHSITLHKLRKSLGIEMSSEKLRDLCGENTTAGESKDKLAKPPRQRPPKPKSTTPPVTINHALTQYQSGEVCPACEIGKLYSTKPARLLRITGQSPYARELHLAEQRRCNACGAYFTAPLPEAVTVDGEPQQQYGYSARSLMVLSKYFAGSPFYRQECLQGLLGVAISSSTFYDQSSYVANDVTPLFDRLKELAANAVDYLLDDTGHRILKQGPVMKKRLKQKKAKRRTGIYASGVIANLSNQHQIVLFQTNVGHAGELIDELLEKRSPDQPPPILMSDALANNNPQSGCETIRSLCNTHGRRQFADVFNHFPTQVEYVLKQYQTIWLNEATVVQEQLSPEQRLAYHQTHSLPVMAALREWGNQLIQSGKIEDNSGLGKAICYFDRHYEGLTRFCTHVGARLDNNLMEAMLKLIVRGRKNSLFYKTQTGANVADVLTSVIATAASAGINVFDYLNAIQRNKAAVKANPDQWLPWDFKAEK